MNRSNDNSNDDKIVKRMKLCSETVCLKMEWRKRLNIFVYDKIIGII